MSGSVNKVILIGNVGQDPEIRSFQTGGKVCNLSIATSERWKDRETKEQKERTQWHRVVVFNEPLINLIEMYVKKGSKLFIEGQLETRKWTDASGQEKYSTEVVLRAYKGELTFLDSRSNNNDNDSFQSSNQVNETKNTEINQVVNEPSGIDSDIDDDIPF
ncbi:single-stranded DNA-binding protein [Alphaproteobacteria bacterium]|jgi:single-strand DNA-binding protein|nr:single-stranded DNA-binding protein [Alphaproteobacteria bacterium]|tara:strand:- start:569 stop:1051 length:483 start_codon:yes stop_codon:yes gene_type:complete